MADEKRQGPASADDDGPASGSAEHPIAPDEAQPGDRAEFASNLGGPVDIAPGARPRATDRAAPSAPADRPGAANRKD